MEIYCRNINRYLPLHGGETLAEILAHTPELAEMAQKERPICARVNNKTEPLQFQVFGPKMVEYLPRTSGSGERVYIRSLCMMLYCALRRERPGMRLRIEHSISGGYYCRLSDADGKAVIPDRALVEDLRRRMRALNEADLPLERDEILTSDLIELLRREGLDDKVLLLQTVHDLYTTYYRLDGAIDSYYGALAPSTGHIDVFDLRLHKDGFLLFGFCKSNPSVPAQYVTREKMDRAFDENLRFDRIIGVSNVGELNSDIDKGKSAELIQVAEALHDKKISSIADEITRRYHEGGARVVLVAGPSSSGKTTTTKRLGIYLLANLLKPKMISLDNYFVDRERTPRDETGDYDYESLYALDLELFNRDLQSLLDGHEIELPTYNFELGRREYRGERLRLEEGSILLMEGIHGLNPELTASIGEQMKYRVYVSALTTLSIDDHNWIPTSDNRLLRRIIRDHKYRGASAVETLRRWPSVRRGEERWIFPYQENADSTFNSSLLFELGVMRDYGEAILREVPNDCPEYAEAYRLRKFLNYFRPIGERDIPPTSLLREFLGGSSFRY
ncbi:MAG TPA: AAA family ATPase [Porphyromonadaceae bacterium]|nr:AAA family ATPase [Porphyromonadaceae bacterium]